jgi:hypothetical protein
VLLALQKETHKKPKERKHLGEYIYADNSKGLLLHKLSFQRQINKGKGTFDAPCDIICTFTPFFLSTLKA